MGFGKKASQEPCVFYARVHFHRFAQSLARVVHILSMGSPPCVCAKDAPLQSFIFYLWVHFQGLACLRHRMSRSCSVCRFISMVLDKGGPARYFPRYRGRYCHDHRQLGSVREDGSVLLGGFSSRGLARAAFRIHIRGFSPRKPL